MDEKLDALAAVKETARSYRRWAKAQGEKGDREGEETHLRWAARLDAAASELTDLRRKLSPLPTRLGDLSDLPQELLTELSGVETDELEGQLIFVINAYGGTADLNQILVGLFRKYRLVQKRRFVQQKLWRMTQDGILWSIPKRKGIYTTDKSLIEIDIKDKPKSKNGFLDELDDEIPF